MRTKLSVSVLVLAIVVWARPSSGAPSSHAAEIAPRGPPQYLSLPKHPRQPDPSGEGVIEFDDHYIWRAPLDNALPPPMNVAPATPGAPIPDAVRSGDVPSNTAGVNASNASDSYQGET